METRRTMMHWKPRWALIGMLLLAIPGAMTVMKVTAAAQATSGNTIATTQVTDTIYRADGTPAGGTVIVNWQAVTTASGQAVPRGSTSAAITGGGLWFEGGSKAGTGPVGGLLTAGVSPALGGGEPGHRRVGAPLKGWREGDRWRGAWLWRGIRRRPMTRRTSTTSM